MKKKYIILIAIIALIAIGLICYFVIKNNSEVSETYEIQVDLVDSRSPDRTLTVLKNGKATKNYKHIKLLDKDIILCYQKNPTVNMFELESDELIIVLSDDKEVVAKLVRKDK